MSAYVCDDALVRVADAPDNGNDAPSIPRLGDELIVDDDDICSLDCEYDGDSGDSSGPLLDVLVAAADAAVLAVADAVRATVVLLDFIAPASNSAPEVVAAGEAAVFLINDMVCERCICMMSSLY
jgi:hypothetical protein